MTCDLKTGLNKMCESFIVNYVDLFEQANDNNPEVMEYANSQILENMEKSPLRFLQISLSIAIYPSLSEKTVRMALVLSKRSFSFIKSQNPDRSVLEVLNSFNEGLVPSSISICIECLGKFPTHSGSLLGEFVSLLILEDDNSTIIDQICSQINGISDQNLKIGAFSAFEQITESVYLEPNQYQPILTQSFLNLYDQKTNAELAKLCLRTILNLITSISDLFESPENRQAIFDTLLSSLRKTELQPIAFLCFGKISRHYYQYFDSIASTIIEQSLEIINNRNSTNDQITSICKLFKKIAVAEHEKVLAGEEIIGIIDEIIPITFEVLVTIASDHGLIDPDPIGEFFIHNEATLVLGNYFQTSPQNMASISIPWITANIQSETPGNREVSFLLLSYCVNYLSDDDVGSIVSEYLPFIQLSFADLSSRVIESSLFFLYAIVRKYVTSKMYNIIQDYLISMVPHFLTVADSHPNVCCFLSKILNEIIEQGGFPYFTEVFHRFLPFASSSDVDQTNHVFRTLEVLIKHAPKTDDVINLIPQIVELLEQSVFDVHLKKNQDSIYFLAISFFLRAKAAFIPYTQSIFDVFSHEFRETNTLNPVSLLAIDELRIAVGKEFNSYIPETVSMIIYLINRIGNSNEIEDGCAVLSNYIKTVDIKPYINELMNCLISVLFEVQYSYQSIGSILKPIKLFMMKYFEQSSTHILPIIHYLKDIVCNLNPSHPDSIYLTDSVIHFFIVLLDSCDATAAIQWIDQIFELFYKINEINDSFNSDKFTDSSVEDLYDISAQLILRVIDLSPQNSIDFFQENENVLSLILIIAKTEASSTNGREILRQLGIDPDEIE